MFLDTRKLPENETSALEHAGVGGEQVEGRSEVAEQKKEVPPIEPQTEKVEKLNLRRKTVTGSDAIYLNNESGQRIGEAQYRRITTEDFLKHPGVEIETNDKEAAQRLGQYDDDKEIAREGKEIVTTDHIEGALDILILRYYRKTQSEVLRASKVTMYPGERNSVDLRGSTSGRLELNYVIAQSGKKIMESLLNENLRLGLSNFGIQLDNDPIYGNKLGDKGISRTLRVPSEDGKVTTVDINFLYGSEKKSVDDSEEVKDTAEERKESKEDTSEMN